MDINYGFKNLEFTLKSSYTTLGTQEDFEGLKTEIKWLFYGDDFFTMALHPKYISFPIESRFDTGEVYELGLPMNFRLDKSLDLVLNLTYFKPKGIEDHFEFGTYLRYNKDRNSYFLEAYVEESIEHQAFHYLGNIGYRHLYDKDKALLLSLGRDLKTKADKRTLIYVGLLFII